MEKRYIFYRFSFMVKSADLASARTRARDLSSLSLSSALSLILSKLSLSSSALRCLDVMSASELSEEVFVISDNLCVRMKSDMSSLLIVGMDT